MFVAGFPRTPLGDVLTAPRRPALPAGPGRAGRRRDRGARARPRRRGAARHRHLDARGRPAPGPGADRARGDGRPARRERHRRGRRRRARAGWPTCSAAPANAERATASRPSATRTSTRPGCGRCARRSASAPAPSPTSWRWPRSTPTCVFACSSAQQYAWMQQHQPELFERIRSRCRGRAVRAGRRHVGGVRHQHAGRRGDGPPARARQAVLPRGVRRRDPTRCGCPTPSATPPRCRRSPGWPACAGSSPRRCRGTRPTGSRTTRSGGRASTAPGSSPTSRPSTPTTPSCPRDGAGARGCGTSPTKGRGHAVAGAVRLRRRRRRPDPRDGRAGPPAAPTWRARRGSRSSTPADVLRRRRRRSTPTRRCGRASCTWSTTAAPTPRRSRRSRATAAASTCCARPSCGRRPRRRCGPARAYPYDELDAALADGAAAPVPRHPAGHARSPGCTARPRETYAASWPTSSSAVIARRRSRALAGDGRHRLALQRRPARASTGVPALRRPRRRGAGRRGARRPRRRDGRRHRAGQRPAPGRASTRDGLVASVRRPAPPAGRCSPRRAGQPAAAAPATPPTVGRLGHRRHYRAHRSPTCTTPTSVDDWSRRAARAVVRVRRSAPSPVRAGGPRSPPGSRRLDLETDGRLARAETLLKAGLPARRARRPVRLGDPVRPRAPADARQHQLGRGAVRDLRAPLGARRRAGLRRRAASTTPPTATTSTRDPRGDGAARPRRSGSSLLRAPRYPRPGDRPGRRTASATRWSPAPASRTRSRGLRAQPAAAGGRRRRPGRAARPVDTGDRGRRGGEARRGPQRRRGGPALRVARRPRRRARCGPAFDVVEARGHRPARADDHVAADLAPLDGRRRHGLSLALGPFQIVTLRLTPN